MIKNVGICALTSHMPEKVLSNEYFCETYPEAYDTAEQRTLARIFTTDGQRPTTLFDRAMEPYLRDPFRGARERRVTGPDETGLDLEYAAARKLFDAHGCLPSDIDLLISVGFLPASLGIGNAVHLAARLELQGAAWNMESACGGPLNAFQTACALVRSGEYRNVLVTVSCTYSRVAPPDDTMCWFLGDGGGAFLVSETPQPSYLAGEAVHSASTCGSWFYDLAIEDGKPTIIMGASKRTGELMRSSAEPYVKRCCDGALKKAGLTKDDIDFFVFHSPVAWFAEFGAQVLDVDPSRTASTYPYYANIGPALTPANLHYAAATGKIEPGSTVLVYGPGSASSSAAVIMKWGDVSLGPLPPGVE